jgi:hypothetical protein
MINLEETYTYGFEAAIRGMRNPMNSWDRSDSSSSRIGKNDLDLMKRLIKGGTEHRKFLRMINVTVDITAPLYWWKEFDTYKVGTVANSCSTMHKIHDKEFTLDDFSCEHLLSGSMFQLHRTVDLLNEAREAFLECTVSKYATSEECKEAKKGYWWQMIQLLPSSYNQKRTVQLNYEVLLAQYHQRKGHKLDEWREYCRWIEYLPYMSEFLKAASTREICNTCTFHSENACRINIGLWKDDDYCSQWKGGDHNE